MMPNKDSPCNGCTERFIACSDKCPKDLRGEYGYKAWLADIRKVKAARMEYLMQWREDWVRSEYSGSGLKRHVDKQKKKEEARIYGRK